MLSMRDCVELCPTANKRLGKLTRRERQVVERMVDGAPNKIIAFELSISPRTVEIHRARAMRKMQATSLAEMIHLALASTADTLKPTAEESDAHWRNSNDPKPDTLDARASRRGGVLEFVTR